MCTITLVFTFQARQVPEYSTYVGVNYGTIEKLIEAFGFESVIKREEKLELIVAIGERKNHY